MRILWIRLRSLGDAILTLPVLGYLHRKLPDAKIDFVLHPAYAPLFEGHPWIHRVLTVPRNWKSYLRILTKQGSFFEKSYDVVVNAHGGRMSTWILQRVRSPMRIGFDRFPRPELYHIRVPLRSSDYVSSHTVLLNARLVEPLTGESPDPYDLYFDGFPNIPSQLDDALSDRGIRIIFHPGGRFRSKRWEDHRIIRFLKNAMEAIKNTHWLLLFGPDERDRMEPYSHLLETHRSRMTLLDAPDLPRTVQIIRLAHLFVGFDSGLVHLASSLHRPVCVFWGPGYPDLWKPWRTPSVVVRPQERCGDCTDKTCPTRGRTYCIDRLDENTIIDMLKLFVRTWIEKEVFIHGSNAC